MVILSSEHYEFMAEEEQDGYEHYKKMYKATKDKRFLKMANDEKRHKLIILRMAKERFK